MASQWKAKNMMLMYFHVLIDQFSRWPEVEVVTSTSFDKLKPALERSWSLLGIPDQVTHDNGPPYNYRKWTAYAQSKTANALFALGLDMKYRDQGLRAFSVHPGGILMHTAQCMQFHTTSKPSDPPG